MANGTLTFKRIAPGHYEAAGGRVVIRRVQHKPFIRTRGIAWSVILDNQLRPTLEFYLTSAKEATSRWWQKNLASS